jgi:iron complex outermembrane receptor protein
LTAAVLLGPATVIADARTDARRFFRQGMVAIANGNVDEGVEALRLAYRALPHPNVLYNIARAYLGANRPVEAIPYLERYLAADPDDRADVERVLVEVRERLAPVLPPIAPEAPEAPPRVPRAGEYQVSDEDVRTIAVAADQLDLLAEAAQSAPLGQQAADLRELADTLTERYGVVRHTAATPPVAATTTAPRTTDAPTLAAEASEQLYEAQVVSASRFVQSTLDAPNSTTIISSQDIRLSGLRSLPEILRRAAGVEVMTMTPSTPELSIRGMNQRLSNKVQVLIDGRSVFLDLLGTTLWATVPVLLEEIERIEIIRGPAAALYGANAFGGVVNIITRAPGERRTAASLAGGTGDFGRGVLSASGRAERLSYRIGVGYEQEDHHSLEAAPERVDLATLVDNPERDLERWIANAEIGVHLPREVELRGGVAVSNARFTMMGIGRLRQVVLEENLFTQAHATITTPIGLRARTFANLAHGTAVQPYAPVGAIEVTSNGLNSQTIDTELVYQKELTLGFSHNLTVGVGHRYKLVDWSWLDAEHEEHHFNAFLQDTMRIVDPVRAVLSARVDRHPLLSSLQLSPRASLILRPSDSAAVRVNVGTAFRSPTYIESYLHFVNQTPIRASTAYGEGNTALEPEHILSAELGYTHQLGDIMEVAASAYYNRVDNQILFAAIQPYTLEDFPGFDEASAAFPVGDLQFTNEDATFQQLGAEIGVHLYPFTGFDLVASYSYHQTTPVGDPDLGGREHDQRTPAHKVNVGVQYRAPFGLDIAVDLYHVSSQLWVEQVIDTGTGVQFEPFALDAYTLLNTRLGYRLVDDTIELAISGTNLLGDRHREHPFGEKVGPRVWASVAVHL